MRSRKTWVGYMDVSYFITLDYQSNVWTHLLFLYYYSFLTFYNESNYKITQMEVWEICSNQKH